MGEVAAVKFSQKELDQMRADFYRHRIDCWNCLAGEYCQESDQRGEEIAWYIGG